jgi:hypothetical protein
MTELPVACTLSDRELAERRGGLLSDLRRHRQETRWLLDGVVLRFPPGPSVIACLAEFIRLESQCCQFLRFHLTVEPDGGPVWLELTGPGGTRDFLAGELELTGGLAAHRTACGDGPAGDGEGGDSPVQPIREPGSSSTDRK